MAALIDYASQKESTVEISLVLADRPAAGLETARQHGLATALVARADHASRDAHEAAIIDAITASGAELICLAGFMRILSASFCARFEGRLINIHPSLLPRHKGLDTHHRALEAGDSEHGCTVHFVTPGMDEGPVIGQRSVAVLEGDTPDTLAARVLVEEHRLYPLVVAAIAAGLVRLGAKGVESQPGALPGQIDALPSPLFWQG